MGNQQFTIGSVLRVTTSQENDFRHKRLEQQPPATPGNPRQKKMNANGNPSRCAQCHACDARTSQVKIAGDTFR